MINRFKKISDEAESNLKEEKSWFEELKKNILNLFFNQDPKFELDKEALNAIKRYVLDLKTSGLSFYDPKKVLETIKPLVIEKFKENYKTKQKLSIICLMEKIDIKTGEIETKEANFNSKHNENIFEGSNFDEIYQQMCDEIILQFKEFINNGSMWNFVRGLKIILNIYKYNPLKASSWIPLPRKIKLKKAVINPKNNDQKCFLWCIGIYKLLEKNINMKKLELISNNLKKEVEKFNLDGIEFPCGYRDIDKFEKNNKISINLYGWENETNEVSILRISKEKQNKTYVDLLLINDENRKHYCLIKNLSRLDSKQFNKHGHKTHTCHYCLNYFTNEKTLKEHLEYCVKHDCVKTIFPKKGEKLKFKNYEKMHNVPFVIYLDLESNLKKIDKKIGGKTTRYQKHKMASYGYLILCFDKSIYKPKLRIYTKKSENENISLKLIKSLENDVREISNEFIFPKKIMREVDIEDFENASSCYACGIEFLKEVEKVKDHCHYTGKFRGASCKTCNFKMKNPKFIPIITHNLANYDSNLFIKNLGKTPGEIKCIAKTEENYISFSKEIIVGRYKNKKTKKIVNVKRELRFIDSFKFMAYSLENLSNNLEKDDCCYLNSFFEDEEERILLKRKGVFPYDWFDSIEKLNEKNLPQKKKNFIQN